MKIVVTADMHIHPWRLCSRDGGHDRLMDGLSVLRQSLDLARREKAVWIFVGDMKVPKMSWPQSALTGVHQILRGYRDVEQILVCGNHDAEGIGGSGLAPFKDVARVVEEALVVEVAGAEVVCAPWNANLETVRHHLARTVRARSPLVAHGFLQGCMLGPEDARIARGTPVSEYGDFSVAFFGDVHKGQWRRPGGDNRPPEWFAYPEDGGVVKKSGPWGGEVFYAGSAYQQNWGERNDPAKGALVVDLETGEVRLHPLASPRYRHFELDEKTIDDFTGLYDPNMDGVTGDFVRVIYTGKPRRALDNMRRVGDQFRSFQLIVRQPERPERRSAVHAGMATSDLIRSYVSARPPVDLDAEKTVEAGVRLSGYDG